MQIVMVHASQLPMVSRPGTVTRLIVDAARSSGEPARIVRRPVSHADPSRMGTGRPHPVPPAVATADHNRAPH
jgi:hypothetical protein